ncbi:MAG: hypothetical protein H7318_15060 [Oligoflexus sp.]|nr:hypothetical protein [Oligoflexus sp.]
MRVEQGLAFLAMMGGLQLAAFNTSCKSEKKTNEGFPVAIEDLKASDYEDTVWQKIRTKLGIDPIGGSSADDLIVNLATPSDLISDPELAAAENTTQVAKVIATAEQSVCQEIKVPLIDINPGAAVGLSGGFSLSNGAPKALPAPAKVYLMNYKLKGDAAYRNALITVPSTAPTLAHMASPLIAVKSESNGSYGYPLILYAHAAASGFAYEEIAQSLGDLQSGNIIAAPVFPGEPLCTTYDTVSGTKTTSCSGSNISSAAVGRSLPFENDVTDLHGLYDCMKTWAAESTARVVFNTQGAASGTENLSTKIVKVNASAQAALASSSPVLAAAAGGPITVVAGLGRGATVAGLTLVRAGALNSVYLASTLDTAAQIALATKGVFPALFSCSLLIAPQASFTSGKNKIYLDFWSKESSSVLTPAQALAIESIPTFASIHAKIKAFRADSAKSEDDRATAIADYVKGIDLLMHLPLVHGGLQNFGKQFTSKLLAGSNATSAANTSKAAQGHLLLLHGSKDKIADVGNSDLLSGVGVETSNEMVLAGLVPGVKWLALDVAPPAASLDESGALPASDYGHVSSANFVAGTTAQETSVQSNYTVTEYLSLTPAAVTAKWFATQCVNAIDASAVP